MNTATTEQTVQRHYTVEGLAHTILGALQSQGADLSRLGPDDLAPVDEFHIRGRESTAELAALAQLQGDTEVLDIGSGLGGTARFLAADYGCRVTGVDVTPGYCDVASDLSARLGLSERTRFRQGSALDLPFHDETFDVVWTEHVQMNIADKRRFYAEAARVLKPGGKLVFHDIFAGPGAPPQYPVPWAATSEISFLAPVAEVRFILDALGLRAEHWIDSSAASRQWFASVLARNAEHGPPPLGLHLLMGPTGKEKFSNLLENFRGECVQTIQAVLRK